MQKILSHIDSHKTLTIIISSVAAALAHTFSFLSPLSWVSLVFLFYIILKSDFSFKTSIWYGLCFGFFYHISIYWWFLELYPFDAIGLDEGVALFVALLGWIGISAFHTVIYSLVFIIPYFFIKKLNVSQFKIKIFLIPSAWLVSEWLTSLGALALPWSRISLTQAYSLPLIQSLSLFGAYFLSFIIILVNTLLAASFLLNKKSKKRIAALAALTLFLSNLAFGSIKLLLYNENGTPIKVSLIQGNILSGEKWQDGKLDYCLDTYVSLSRQAFEETCPNLVIWPESAVPVNIDVYTNYLTKYKSLSKELDTPLLIGTLTKNDSWKSENSTVLVTKDEVLGKYSKQHLVPFGEYIPYHDFFSFIFPAIDDIYVPGSNLEAGVGSQLIELNSVKIGSLVCFDSIFASLSRNSAKDGAHLFAIVTNDSWYKDSVATSQHLKQAVFRAVENSRYVARAANSGISAFINPNGEIQESLKPLVSGYITKTIYAKEDLTLYTHIGDLFLYLVFTGLFVLLFYKSSMIFVSHIKQGKNNG